MKNPTLWASSQVLLLGLGSLRAWVICICLGRTEFCLSLLLLLTQWRLKSANLPWPCPWGLWKGRGVFRASFGDLDSWGDDTQSGWVAGKGEASDLERGLDSFDSSKDPWVERFEDYWLGEKSEFWVLKILLVQSSCQALYRGAETVTLAGAVTEVTLQSLILLLYFQHTFQVPLNTSQAGQANGPWLLPRPCLLCSGHSPLLLFPVWATCQGPSVKTAQHGS